jgi:hypothetical protein
MLLFFINTFDMKKYFQLFLFVIISSHIFAQQKKYFINVQQVSDQHKVIINVNDQPFTEFIFPDSLEKPVLFPIYAPDGNLVTRGFPLAPRAGEPTDHPHHFGLWFNYEKVNGLDFWNNSYNIPADKKHLYGWIKTNNITQTKSGEKGLLTYNANWTDQQKNILLIESTTFIFSANNNERIIDRTTTLIAQQDIFFEDTKDGMLGLRVAHELELPIKDERQFIDDKGNITKVAVSDNSAVTGNYLTSEGKQGDSAWGTRAKWCLLYGKKNNDTISIAIIDNPQNPGYPTFWHARGYGLFAANTLGQKIFSNGKLELNFKLKKGESATFRYRIVIAAGKQKISIDHINKLSDEFAKLK